VRPLRRFVAAAIVGLAAAPAAAQMPPYTERITGTLVTFEMLPVPAGAGQRAGATDGVAPFWMMKTEVTWDLYDVYLLELDKPDTTARGRAADAVARPSKPYVLPGDAFGHRGYPAIGMSLHAARQFAAWLTAKTGNTYRLPTAAEWLHACRTGAGTGAGAGPRGAVAARAWHAANAQDKTHPVGTRSPDTLGLPDMRGNVAEWTVMGADSGTIGGDYATLAKMKIVRREAPVGSGSTGGGT
jgi:formylglycine-generating enzyme required for sulfatase activity